MSLIDKEFFPAVDSLIKQALIVPPKMLTSVCSVLDRRNCVRSYNRDNNEKQAFKEYIPQKTPPGHLSSNLRPFYQRNRSKVSTYC